MKQAALLLALACAVPTAARAHEGKVLRSLYLEASADQLVVLAHLSVRGEDRQQALRGHVDLNRDGKLDAKEKAGLQELLATRALAGLVLEIDGRPVSVENMQAKLLLPEEEGPYELATHGTVPLPAAAKTIELRTAPDAEPLTLRLVPGKRRLVSKRGKLVAKGMREIEVGPGDSVVIELSTAQ